MNKDNKFENTVGIESTFPKDMPNEHGEIPVWNSENWFYEDVIVGHKIRSLRRTISEGEAMQFNCMVLDIPSFLAKCSSPTYGCISKTIQLNCMASPSDIVRRRDLIL